MAMGGDRHYNWPNIRPMQALADSVGMTQARKNQYSQVWRFYLQTPLSAGSRTNTAPPPAEQRWSAGFRVQAVNISAVFINIVFIETYNHFL